MLPSIPNLFYLLTMVESLTILEWLFCDLNHKNQKLTPFSRRLLILILIKGRIVGIFVFEASIAIHRR